MNTIGKEKLREFLRETLAKHGDRNDLTDSESIFVSGRLDSFSMMMLVMHLEESFGIDFSSVEYLDSSALGMLLMLRDKMGGAKKDVSLSGVHGNVKQVLEIANFGQLFHIIE